MHFFYVVFRDAFYIFAVNGKPVFLFKSVLALVRSKNTSAEMLFYNQQIENNAYIYL